MTAPYPRLLVPARIDWQDGSPRSRASGDIYFSRHDGVAETRAVFLAGNDLPARFAALPPGGRFCIGETGFGTGLNFLVARRAFLDHAPPDARLDFVSVEHAPVAETDLLRCAVLLDAAGHRAIAGDMARLATRMPPPVRGWHRLAIAEADPDGTPSAATDVGASRVQLSLWFGAAASGFEDWLAQRRVGPVRGSTSVDAWFLDGFAPRLNPELWTTDLLRCLADLSTPLATLATFSVARSVREALAAAGFEGHRVQGPESKRQVLRATRRETDRQPAATASATASARGAMARPEAPSPAGQPAQSDAGAAARSAAGKAGGQQGHRPDGPPATNAAPRSARRFLVLGAGLAGASTAAALARRGHAVLVCDPAPPARAASGNPWAVLHPRLPLDDGPRAGWLLAAHHYAWQWLAPFQGRGWEPGPVLQVPEARRPERMLRLLERFATLAPRFGAATLGGAPALRQARGGCADLPRIVAALLDHPRIRVRSAGGVATLRATDDGWALTRAGDDAAAAEASAEATATGDPVIGTAAEVFAAVIVAAGHVSGTLLAPWLPPGCALPLGRMRGQVSRFRSEEHEADVPADPGGMLTGRGYAVPQDGAWISGSSYVRDGGDGPASAREREENEQRLRAWFTYLGWREPQALTVDAEFCGVRANLPDRVPAVGRIAPGLWVNAGHASSGLTTCPVAAEHLAARLCGEPPVLDGELCALLDPLRFPASRSTG